MRIKIFYSWQSTTEKKYNWDYIKDCIKRAIHILEQNPNFNDVKLELLPNVGELSGSRPVASTITNVLIPSSDIFIADISFINYIPKWKQCINSLIGVEYKMDVNSNVIHEYGVAKAILNSNVIITILNNAYGSLDDKNYNLPFDITSFIYPIEYSCKQSNFNNNDIKEIFVKKLSEKLRITVIEAIENRRNKFIPFIDIKEWQSILQNKDIFIENDKIIEIKKQVINAVQIPRTCIRVLGLSGLGKTRILFEILNNHESTDSLIKLKNKVLYLDYNTVSSLNINDLVSRIIAEDESRILVIDNCPENINRDLLRQIKKDNSKVSLLTINSNPNEKSINEVNDILIKKDDLISVVNDIVEKRFSMLEEHSRKKIIEFSQGIPLMAVLLCENLRDLGNNVGELSDKSLLNNLLGEDGNDEKKRNILRASSLFNYFGYKDNRSSQMSFIARNTVLTNIEGGEDNKDTDFYSVCQKYLKREIFERRGRFIGMRPLPLAYFLVEEWLDNCMPTNFVRLIEDIAKLAEPDRKELSNALAIQMQNLNYNDRACELVEKITGAGNPFDNAEVLNTELGSRLFRSFVEVNPIAISNNLVRNFLNKSKVELLEVKDGRRNLIWTLEKLCFDSRTFAESAKVLFAFAVAENEFWSNNAEGQFIHMFSILLSGTEVNLEERLKIIEWGLAKNDSDYLNIAIKAMGVGLNNGQFLRFSGAEVQGSNKLKDYVPTWLDVENYWKDILSKLKQVVISETEKSEEASKIIAESIRGICNARLSRIILPVVKEIVEFKNNDWEEVLESLKHTKRFESKKIDKEGLITINALISSLTSTDFEYRYRTINKTAYLDIEDYSTDKVEQAVVKLADEYVNMDLTKDENIELIYTHHQIFGFSFGRRLEKLLEEKGCVPTFINKSIEIISKLPKKELDVIVLLGVIAETTEDIKKKFYNVLYNHECLNYLLFLFIGSDNDGYKYFDLLFKLIDENKCDLNEFGKRKFIDSIKNIEFEELKSFCQKLFTYGHEGYIIVFENIDTLAYFYKNKYSSFQPLIKECIKNLGVVYSNDVPIDYYKWSNAICEILKDKKESDFAKFVNKSIIDSISGDCTYNLNNGVQAIYKELLDKHFAIIWEVLSKALLSSGEDYWTFYGLKNILGSEIGYDGQKDGVLLFGNIDEIFKWCRDNKDLAPQRIAELLPIYGGDINKDSGWHPVTKRLIDEFGDVDGMLNALSVNMGNMSWTGSLVPYINSKIVLFESLFAHDNENVSTWAKRRVSYLKEEIKIETIRDEELFM